MTTADELLDDLVLAGDRNAILLRSVGAFDDADHCAQVAEFFRSRGVHKAPQAFSCALHGLADDGALHRAVFGWPATEIKQAERQLERMATELESVWASLERWQRGEQIESDYLDGADWEALARAESRRT